jgi:predicted transcriptional regulator
MMCRSPDYRAALQQIADLLAESLAELCEYSYRDLVELTVRLERLAHDALYPDPKEIPQ